MQGKSKVLILAISAIAAGASGAQALSNVVTTARPALAQTLWPANADAYVQEAALRVGVKDPPAADVALADRLARRALAAQPLNASALEILGVTALQRKQDPVRYFTLADTFSRRTPYAQFWLTEQAITNGRLDEALRHIDIAVTSSPSAASILYPVLTKGLPEPALRRGLARYFAQGSDWTRSFFAYAVDNAENADYPAELLNGNVRWHDSEFDDTIRRLMERLAGEKSWSNLLAVYRLRAGSQADPALPTSPALTAASTDQRFSPLTWDLPTQGSGAAMFVSDGGAGQLRLEAFDVRDFVVARKILLLGPGAYRLTYDFADKGDADGAASITVQCVGAAAILHERLAARSVQAFAIPTGCPAQELSLVIDHAGTVGGFTGTISRLQIRRN